MADKIRNYKDLARFLGASDAWLREVLAGT